MSNGLKYLLELAEDDSISARDVANLVILRPDWLVSGITSEEYETLLDVLRRFRIEKGE